MDIQEDILACKLSFAEIAAKYGVPFDTVDLLAAELASQGDYDRDYLDSDAHLEYLD
jgi:hypothetical protein